MFEEVTNNIFFRLEIKDYNVMIDRRNFFDQPVINIRKIAIGKGDNYTAGCLVHYPCFKKYYKLIALSLSKQQEQDADPIAIQQINFAGNLDRDGNTKMFFIIEEAKSTVLDFSKGTVKVL